MYIAVAAPIIGGLLGGMSSKKGTTTEAKKEPWAPAQQYLIDNLATNKQLQDYYAQNPFNGLQQQGYANLYGDQNNLRQNIAPGMMDFANQMMGSKYERKAVSRPGEAAGYTGLLSSGGAPAAPSSGLLGPFSVAPSTPYKVGNLNQQNPLYKAPPTPEQAQAAALAEQERLRLLAQQQPAQGLDWYQNQMTGLGA